MAATLTPEQLTTYFNRIEFPEHYRRNVKHDYDFLAVLQAYHISAIPYENLGLHYSADAHIPLDLPSLFAKCTQNGRGGYCMENATFFNVVLRSLGFSAYMAGARARPRVDFVPRGDFTGWMHVVNIITLPNSPTKYVMDVGFGGDMPTKPLPLVSGPSTLNIGTQEVRLNYAPLPKSHSNNPVWIYEYRNQPTDPWNAAFSFTETEFLEQDLEVLNFYTSKDPRCFQTRMVLVVKFLREGDRVYGKKMLIDGVIKLNDGGRTRTVFTCETEDERTSHLKTEFGIGLTPFEKQDIFSRPTALRKQD
ncbi:arylamine N-acetyltransferase 1 [Phyllosticta capitalensis]